MLLIYIVKYSTQSCSFLMITIFCCRFITMGLHLATIDKLVIRIRTTNNVSNPSYLLIKDHLLTKDLKWPLSSVES